MSQATYMNHVYLHAINLGDKDKIECGNKNIKQNKNHNAEWQTTGKKNTSLKASNLDSMNTLLLIKYFAPLKHFEIENY